MFALNGYAAPQTLRVSDFRLGTETGGSESGLRDLERLLRSVTPTSVALGWKVYFETPLARLFERGTGQGGFDHGMGAMLALPARGLAEFAEVGCSVFGGDAVTVVGVSLHDSAVPDKPVLPAVYGFDASRLESRWRPPRDRQDQVMAWPALLPGWRVVPAAGPHAGWSGLTAHAECREAVMAQWIASVARQHRVALWKQTVAVLRVGMQDIDSVGVFDKMASRMQAAEEALGECIAQAFVQHLDAVVARGCVARRGVLRPAEYNWVAGGGTAREWQRRMDALEIFPGLCTSAVPPVLPMVVPAALAKRSPVLRRLKRWTEDPAVRGAYTLCEAVDQGLPLVRHLSRSFGVKPSTIRALRGVGAREAALLQAPPLGWPDLLRALDSIAPERHPRTPSAWQDFSLLYTEGLYAWRVVHALNIGVGQQFLTRVLRPWLARAGRDWRRAATRWRDGFRHVDGLHLAAEWGQDLKSLMTSPRLQPARRRRLVDALGRAPLDQWQRMVEVRAAWRRPRELPPQPDARHAAAAARPWRSAASWAEDAYVARHTGPWHRLTDELDFDVGLPLCALNSADQLRQESAAMRHCIHTYRSRLLSMPQLAFALGRDRAADRSTVLLGYERRSDGAWEVQVIEHKAERNRRPGMACEAAAQRLVQQLAAPRARDAMDRAEHARALRVQALKELGAAAPVVASGPTIRNPRPDTERRAAAEAVAAEAVARALHVLQQVRLLEAE